ncbi:MAG: YIP1 family protein [Clostridia bacterium]|nr:YIP1 family protein [Clostridia bacterium]
MKKNILTKVIVIALALLTVLAIPAGASSAYQTYTYSISGNALYSPDAYSATMSVSSVDMGLDLDLSNPQDLLTDEYENVYIADKGNNRVVILDRYFKFKYSLSTFINEQGIDDALKEPQGVFVSKDRIWVCDTGNNRIVTFDREGKFLRILTQPKSALFDANAVYKPVAVAVDANNRVFVVSSTTYQGIIVLTEEGEFTSFIGAQAVSVSAWEAIVRRFQTKEQQKQSRKNVSTEFNNISITSDGFIYVTTNSIDESRVAAAITGKATSGDYLPVKLLNSKGAEIMRRNGFWPPAGEINYSRITKDTYSGVSSIIDVAVGPAKTWSIIDEKRGKIYTYDFDGNLLFAFGDTGSMLGSISNIEAITYQGDRILVLDKGNNCVVVFNRTEYGNLLIQAIEAENSLDYDYAIACWREVLQRNSNFDAAYVGIGQAMYRRGEYKESLEYFERAYDTSNWSDAYKEVRKNWMSTFFFILIVIIAATIVGFVLLFKKAGKVNAAAAINGKARKTYAQELWYGLHLILHPFDGFWDLKHEHRGSVRAAVTFNVLAILSFFYQSIGQGYVFNPRRSYMTIWGQALSVLVPLFLFVVANWCLTTLFDGEGSFKDVYIAASYCLVPIPLLVIPATIVSNFTTSSEAGLISLFTTLAFVWMGILLFFGTMVTHDYSLGKNFITFLGTIVGIVFIMFVAVLFSTLVAKLISLITNIVVELQYRA